MELDKRILEIELKSLEPMVNKYFKRLSGIDVEAVPEKYGDTVRVVTFDDVSKEFTNFHFKNIVFNKF